MRIGGKGVIITGATSGIGYSLAKRIYALGGELFLVGRNEQRLESLKSEFKDAVVLQADLTDQKQRSRIISYAIESLNSVDILINNAGIGYFGSLINSNIDELRKVMETNFWAPLDLSINLVRSLNHKRLVIVNVVSLISFIPLPKWNIYATSKFAQRTIFQSLREELRSRKIKLINVYPPAVRTPFFENSLGEKPPILGFAIPPEKVAEKIVKAIEKEEEEVFISFADFLASKFLSIFTPTVLRILGYR